MGTEVAARRLRAGAEVILLALAAYSPWPFASASAAGELVLRVGLLGLALLWAAHAVVAHRFAYTSDRTSSFLFGLVLLTGVQLVPLPESAVRVLSPQAAAWHRELLPEQSELFPGEVDRPGRATWLPLSVDPALTSDFLAQLLAVALAYALTRNLVAAPGAMWRLAWVAFAVGLLLAVAAFAQILSGPRDTMYGRFHFVNQVFGPFINKNHYPDYLALCVGLGFGLLLRSPRWSPRFVGLAAGLGLMLASVAFSRSRGGIAAVAVAGAFTVVVAWPGRVRWLVAGVLVLSLAAWFVGTSGDNRTPLWRELWPIAERFPLTGTGGGTLPRVEPAFRATNPPSPIVVNSAANEYLEAAIEGGFLRVLLTVGLAVSAVATAAVGYRRSRDPLQLGAAFGLAAVAAHSVVDFGTHVPCIALLVAVVAAHSSWRADSSRRAVRREPPGDWEQPGPSRGTARPTLPALAVVFLALLLVWTGWRAAEVERLLDAAERFERSARPHRRERVAELLEAAARLQPDDAEVWARLSAAHFATAHERSATAFISVAGFLAAADPPDAIAGDDVIPALKAARTARDRCPLLPGPHLRLGAYSHRMTRSEPAAVHFRRATVGGGFDPDVWYLAGSAALARGDLDAACENWRESLRRDPRRLALIVRAASRHLGAAELRDRVLGGEPVLVVAAAEYLDADGRRTFLRFAADRWRTRADGRTLPSTKDELAAWATAHERLRELPAAVGVWKAALERFPDSERLRDRLAAALEADERYEEAVPHLERLLGRNPRDGSLRDRLDAARHALALKRQIDAP